MNARRGAVVAAVLAATLVLLLVVVMVPRDDTVSRPDVVVVLGGAGPERAELGIELSQAYDRPLVLSSSAQHFAAERGVRCPPAVCVVTDPETTVGEARDLSALADARGWDRVVVVTTDFHTGRARALFRQCLGDRVAVVGAERPDGRGPGWRRWLNEIGGVIAGTTVMRAC